MDQSDWISRFYRFQAGFYDQTRWAFLFGRQKIVDEVSHLEPPTNILEVGCGTGDMIRRLQRRFPDARFTGIDLAPAMLKVAKSKTELSSGNVRFLNQRYEAPVTCDKKFDLILFSYSLSMMNPGFEEAIAAAREDLAPDGHIAVVDYHDCPGRGMRWYMTKCHVRLDKHLLPLLEDTFTPTHRATHSAYLGWWRYFTFVGSKHPN